MNLLVILIFSIIKLVFDLSAFALINTINCITFIELKDLFIISSIEYVIALIMLILHHFLFLDYLTLFIMDQYYNLYLMHLLCHIIYLIYQRIAAFSKSIQYFI